MSFRKYDANGEYIRKRMGPHEFEETKTEQSHKEEVNINNIVARYAGKEELIAKVASLTEFVYDDVTNNDFQEMMNQMIHARDTFSNVPSQIRKQFNNDPAAFMDFVLDKNNSDQLIEWGLKKAPEVVQPIEVAVVNPETPPDPPVG
jgi:hypothetical protein